MNKEFSGLSSCSGSCAGGSCKPTCKYGTLGGMSQGPLVMAPICSSAMGPNMVLQTSPPGYDTLTGCGCGGYGSITCAYPNFPNNCSCMMQSNCC